LDALGHVRAALHGQRWRSIDEIASVYGGGPNGNSTIICAAKNDMTVIGSQSLLLMHPCSRCGRALLSSWITVTLDVSHVRKGDYDAVQRQ